MTFLYSDFADDPDMAELIDLFLDDLPNRVTSLRAALAAGDMAGLRRFAHQLKGAAGGYGYPTLGEAAAALEHAAAGGLREAVAWHVDTVVQRCAAAFAVRGRRAA